MRMASRIAILTVLTVIISTRGAFASIINVAEFNWTSTLIDPNPNCDPLDSGCLPNPLFQSVFQLTNIWDGPDPGPTLQGSRLTLPTQELLWFDVTAPNDPSGVNFDQIPILDTLPLFAQATIAFTFGGQDYTLTALLNSTDLAVNESGDLASASQVLSIEVPDTPPAPVPEPGTLSLLAVGAVAGWSRARRITTPRH
jgi:PEP-CTERM motif-containing protein